MQDQSALFDRQAHAYDQRVGLSDAVCKAIAQALQALCDARPGDLVLEIGPGTGLVGKWLAQSTMRYVGVDFSRPMLTQFHRQCRLPGHALLLQADGNDGWPLASGSARLLFKLTRDALVGARSYYP